MLVRADANTAIGTGHIMRCLALAQAWQDQGGSVTFACHRDLPQALEARLLAEQTAVWAITAEPGSERDAAQTAEAAVAVGAGAVVVDGYHFGAVYQRAIKEAGLRLLFIDDNGHAEHYSADWVLNQNIHADEALYASREPYTQLLLGTRYVLLRREFLKWRGHRRVIPEVARKLLITMGGSDPDNITLDVLRAIDSIPDSEALQIKVIAGGSNPHTASLMSFARDSRLNMEVLSNVTKMPELMAWADMAISAGGSTVWELCLMGVPAIFVPIAENQRQAMRLLCEAVGSPPIDPSKAGIEQALARHTFRLARDVEHRRALIVGMQAIIEGFGTEEVCWRLQP